MAVFKAWWLLWKLRCTNRITDIVNVALALRLASAGLALFG
ncbi:hypothetical protein [Streptomyces sp. NBC_00576]|nr:hypothetical protein [Streptomyces sp. NBC_00576]WUB74663.1 hypothetical protein OG734_34005 [Streptomyces sp. NBC_00576]